MHFCYVDEAGSCGVLPSTTSPIQPVFALVGLVLDEARIPGLTRRLIALKERFYPGRMETVRHRMDRILVEVKGSQVRRAMRSGRRRLQRHAMRFIDNLLGLLEDNSARLLGRAWVKGVNRRMDSRSIYTSGMQAICAHFQTWLAVKQTTGLVVADGRRQCQNIQVSYSVFTGKFRSDGDRYGRLPEVPLFGNSRNHAGLQMADLVCSGLVFPIACHRYCSGIITSVHVSDHYGQLHEAFADRLRHLQYRYKDAAGRWSGGLTVSDRLGGRKSSHFF